MSTNDRRARFKARKATMTTAEKQERTWKDAVTSHIARIDSNNARKNVRQEQRRKRNQQRRANIAPVQGTKADKA